MLVKLIRQNEILEVNKQDLHEAKRNGLDGAMLARLALTPVKLQALSAGIEQVLNLITLKDYSNNM
jgi:glutamate-5-semialdehyde dehydrogenase